MSTPHVCPKCRGELPAMAACAPCGGSGIVWSADTAPTPLPPAPTPVFVPVPCPMPGFPPPPWSPWDIYCAVPATYTTSTVLS